MSTSRLGAALAVALLTTVPLTMAAPDNAAAETAQVSAHARSLPQRSVTATVVKRNGKLIMKGKVSPGHVKKSVYIQKKKCRTCAWKPFAKATTNDRSNYRMRIYAPRKGAWFWRAKVRAYGRYTTSYSGVWKTYVV
jgi:hypothetical protein